ncbi:MAG: hypothetical protein ACU85U_19910 [Gammaproteobacteria bacterium]
MGATIAFIASACLRVRTYFWSGIDIDGRDDPQAWMARLEARPACQRGIVVPAPLVLEDAQKMAQQIVTK